ncbi:MAG: B3/B4 domain-containing protein [Candidatus Baldrarchaeia archaeon]
MESHNDKKLTIIVSEDVKERIPEFPLGIAYISGVSVQQSSEQANELLERISSEVRSSLTLEGLKDDPIIRAYRDFYWHYLKIDPTKIRPASEALIRRILHGKTIPRILDAVDAYNAASIETKISMGGYDADKITFPLYLRFAQKGEEFVAIGGKKTLLKGGELVLADVEKIICLYPHRDSDHTKISTSTKNILIVGCGVPGISSERVLLATRRAAEYVKQICGGEIAEIKII